MAVVTTTRISAMATATDFEAFYRRDRDGVYRALALTLGDPDLAAEAVDEAMVRAYQRFGAVSRYDNPAGWVYRVALNWAVSHLRRRRRPSPPSVAVVDPPSLPDPVLAGAIRHLPTEQRAVVVLRFSLDWSLDEIARSLHVPIGTVKSRLHRALSCLRDELGDEHES